MRFEDPKSLQLSRSVGGNPIIFLFICTVAESNVGRTHLEKQTTLGETRDLLGRKISKYLRFLHLCNERELPKTFKILRGTIHLSILNIALSSKEWLDIEGCRAHKERLEYNKLRRCQNTMCNLSEVINFLCFSLIECLLPFGFNRSFLEFFLISSS